MPIVTFPEGNAASGRFCVPGEQNAKLGEIEFNWGELNLNSGAARGTPRFLYGRPSFTSNCDKVNSL